MEAPERKRAKLPQPVPASGSCHFYVKRKNRYCHFRPVQGFTFCTHHLVSDGVSERIPCPVNPNHSVAAATVAQHVRVCPDARRAGVAASDAAWYRAYVNAGPGEQQETERRVADEAARVAAAVAAAQAGPAASSTTPGLGFQCKSGGDAATATASSSRHRQTHGALSTALPEDVARVVRLVCAAYQRILASDTDACLLAHVSSPVDFDYAAVADVDMGAKAFKHAAQHHCLLTQLQQRGWLADARNTLVLELGAGKAKLSEAIHAGTGGATRHLCVDRANQRNRASGAWLERITTDLRDLYLPGALASSSLFSSLTPAHSSSLSPSPCTAQPATHVLAVSKHLCGAATDYSLRAVACAMSLPQSDDPAAVVDACAIAVCCHHRCSWSSFVAADYLARVHAFDRESFAVACAMTNWRREDGRSECAPEPEDGFLHQLAHMQADHVRDLSLDQREVIGLLAKRVITAARLHWLRSQHGICAVGVVPYIGYHVTSENLLLWFQRKTSV